MEDILFCKFLSFGFSFTEWYNICLSIDVNVLAEMLPLAITCNGEGGKGLNLNPRASMGSILNHIQITPMRAVIS